MNILRKIFGIFLMILSLFLIIAIIGSTITNTDIPKESGAERTGYIIGRTLFILLMGCLIYYMIKKGIGFLKNKPQNTIDEIDEIGQS